MIEKVLELLKTCMAEKVVRYLVGAAIVLIGIGAYVKRDWWEPERQMFAQSRALANYQETMKEYGRHMGEDGSVVPLKDIGPNDRLDVKVYASDWCAFLIRTKDGKKTGRLITDLSLDPHSAESAWFSLDLLEPSVKAESQCDKYHADPPIQTWMGNERQGPCLVLQYWLWSDGCVATQWADACDGGRFVGPPAWRTCYHGASAQGVSR